MSGRLGELLVRENLISVQQLRKAQEDQQKHGTRIGTALIKTGAIEESKLTDFLSKQYGVPAINLKDFDIDPEIIKLVSKEVAEDVEVTHEEEVNIEEAAKAADDAPVVKLVNLILLDAIKKGASDIHVEPYEKDFRVRFRIDGVLYEVMRPPMKLRNAITSRLKIMAQLDISERRLPQDGRIKIKVAGGKEMDFRVS